jgi:hypothetical protein
MFRSLSLAVLISAAACLGKPDDRPQTADYIIEAILVPQCGRAACHSAAARSHDLAFDNIPDSLDAMMSMGRRGSPMLAAPAPNGSRDPNGSRLFTVLVDPSRPMPPDTPLPKADIDLIYNWIKNGAEGL